MPEFDAQDARDLSAINAVLSFATSEAIRSQQFDDPRNRRPLDFDLYGTALEGAERMVAKHGAHVPLRAATWRTPAGLLIDVRNVVESAAEYRPKRERRI